MQNQIQNCDLLNKLPGLILAALPIVIVVFLYLYVRNIFKKTDEIEENIFIVKDWADNLEYIVFMQRGPISQSVLDRIVEREYKTLKAELDYLKMKRQYLLDRIPLMGLLKK